MLGPEEVDAIMGIFKLPVRKLKPRQVKEELQWQYPESNIDLPVPTSGNKGTLESIKIYFLVVCKF